MSKLWPTVLKFQHNDYNVIFFTFNGPDRPAGFVHLYFFIAPHFESSCAMFIIGHICLLLQHNVLIYNFFFQTIYYFIKHVIAIIIVLIRCSIIKIKNIRLHVIILIN